MSQKRFTFDDDNEETIQRDYTQSQIEQYESIKNAKEETIKQQKSKMMNKQNLSKKNLEPSTDQPETISSPSPQKQRQKTKTKTKIKKKVKKKVKTKRPQKIVKEKKKRSWFSTLLLLIISLFIMIGICVGGYIAYDWLLIGTLQIQGFESLTKLKKTYHLRKTPPLETTGGVFAWIGREEAEDLEKNNYRKSRMVFVQYAKKKEVSKWQTRNRPRARRNSFSRRSRGRTVPARLRAMWWSIRTPSTS